ncbi:hypothetical protein AS159_05050 [Thermotoga sp. Ku-13t]|uniref:hypothetical protein n=1 Tax=Thermotoga sp. Ku-13t TaxID=1755813 RepID=UPI0013EB6648|nr:hypothetical protein [Thermotoga sp. Ku-13t]KAF2957778.1 hypothetical protein AS159_05050 [Thermotoga sp. Ku-13t]
MKPYWTLTAEERKVLKQLSSKLSRGTYIEDPAKFGIKSAKSATVTVHTIHVDAEKGSCAFSGVMHFEADDDKSIVLAIRGVCANGKMMYIIPSILTEFDAFFEKLDPQMTMIVYPNEVESEIFVSKGVGFVGGFFKSLSTCEESLGNAARMFQAMMEEFEKILNQLPEEEKTRFEEEILNVASNTQNVFHQISKVTLRMAQLYTKIVDAQ